MKISGRSKDGPSDRPSIGRPRDLRLKRLVSGLNTSESGPTKNQNFTSSGPKFGSKFDSGNVFRISFRPPVHVSTEVLHLWS